VNLSRVQALAARIVRGMRRDRRTLALIVIVPLVVMALIGYLVGDNKEDLRVAVPSEPSGGVFSTALDAQPGLTVIDVGSEQEANRMLDQGDLEGVILTPFGQRNPTRDDTVTVRVAGVDVRIEEPIVRGAAAAFAQLTVNPLPPDQLPGVKVERVDVPGSERPSTISYSAPAMVTVFAFLFTFMLTSVAFLRERSSGTLERLLASPISKAEVLSGYLVGFLGFAMIQALVVLGYATLVLDAQVSGALWLVFVILILLVLGVVNLGITLSFFARNELQVIQFIPLMLLPQVFLGGLFWPTQVLWPPLRALSRLFPITYAVAALRDVMIAGKGLGDVAGDLLALLAFAVAMLGLGVIVLRGQRA